MTDIVFPAGLFPDFDIHVLQGDGEVTVQLVGDLYADSAAKQLQPPLLAMHQALLKAKIARVRLDLRKLEYMNSSGIKALAAWILAAEQAADSGYRIELIFDPQSSWQERSLGALSAIAPRVTSRAPVAATG